MHYTICWRVVVYYSFHFSAKVALDGDSYIPPFVSFVYIPMGISSLLKLKESVYHWLKLSGLNKFFELKNLR